MGRPAGRFTQHRRIDRLRTALEEHPQGLTLRQIAQALHVSTRSVRRYLDELEPELHVEAVSQGPGTAGLWRIRPGERTRTVALRRTQALGFIATKGVFEMLRGSALYDELSVAVQQLVPLVRRPTRGEARKRARTRQPQLEERFLFVPSPHRTYAQRGEDLDIVFHAMEHTVPISFHLTGGNKPLEVVLRPYGVLLSGGTIYCVGLDVSSDEMGAFALERMRTVRPREGETFTLPSNLDLASFVEGAFGVTRGLGPVPVLIEFDPSVAEELRGRKFHPTQRVATAADGRIRLSFSTGNLDEVARWVVGFGGSAQVLEPDELVERVRKKLRAALARYAR